MDSAKTRKRSDRVLKRQACLPSLADEGVKGKIKKSVVHKTVQKNSLKGASKKLSEAQLRQSTSKKPVREPSLADEGVKGKIKKSVVHKTVQKNSLKGASKKLSEALLRQSTSKKPVKEPPKEQINESFEGALKEPSDTLSSQLSSEKPVVEIPKEQMDESFRPKKRRKRKMIRYEIDCSCIHMDTTNFRKDLWNRAKNGKLNFVKDVRIKQTGNVIYLTLRSYVSKKCIRSNIHLLATTYFKQKKIDRAVRIVGNENTYKLIYK